MLAAATSASRRNVIGVRAGMVGGALKHDLDPADTHDRCHHADIERLRLQHNALLDMKLQKRSDIVAPRACETIRVAPDPPQCVVKLLTSRLGQFKHPGIERADHAAAADAGQAVFARLLGQEIDDLDRMIKPYAGIAQGAHDFEAGRNACDAVEPPSRGDGIAVRAHRDHPERGVGTLKSPDQVTGGVDPHIETGLGKAPSEPSSAFEKQRPKRAAGVGMRRIGDLRERHHVAPEAIGVERQVGRGQVRLPYPQTTRILSANRIRLAGTR